MVKRKFKKKLRWVGFVLLVIFILISFSLFNKNYKNFFYKIFFPIQKKLWAASVDTSGIIEYFLDSKKVINRLKELEKENKKLEAEIAVLHLIKEENKKLKKTLKLGLEKKFNLYFSQVIGKDVSNNFLLIKGGSDDGILKDMPVITSENVLVGKIKEVYKNFSKVVIISDKNISFDVLIENGEENISGLAKGDGNSKIIIDLIPKGKKILKGDLVVTDSLSGIFPKGLLVGKVTAIEKSDFKSSQKVEVTPFFKLQDSDLFIIKHWR